MPRFRLHEARAQFCLTRDRTFTCNTEHGNLLQREYMSALSGARNPIGKMKKVRLRNGHWNQVVASLTFAPPAPTRSYAAQYKEAHSDYLRGVGGSERFWSQMNPYLCRGKWEGGIYKINVQAHGGDPA